MLDGANVQVCFVAQLEIDNNNITSLPTGFLASVPMLVKPQLAKNPYPVRRACGSRVRRVAADTPIKR